MPDHHVTFGFEAEFSNNVDRLTAYLADAGLSRARNMHAYHCDCDCCDFEDGGVFRSQRDSTCGGEVISQVFDSTPGGWVEAREAMQGLENAALVADAEPGMSAGFHVHVEAPRSYDVRVQMLWEFVRWESPLSFLGQGRWASMRRQNQSLCGLYGEDLAMDPEELYDTHHLADRHSNLNLHTNHGTVEFRLWNSTRAAWRMGLFAGLSVAFTDPAFLERLMTRSVSRSNFVHAVHSYDPALGLMAAAQYDYRSRHARAAQGVPLTATVSTALPEDNDPTWHDGSVIQPIDHDLFAVG